MKKRSFIHELLFYGVIILAIVLVLSTLSAGNTAKEKPTYDDVLRYFNEER